MSTGCYCSIIDGRKFLCESCAGKLQKERDDFEMRWRSLLTELWEGVRIHGLSAPTKGRDGERLIHAYCGGIVERDNQIERLRKVEAWLGIDFDKVYTRKSEEEGSK